MRRLLIVGPSNLGDGVYYLVHEHDDTADVLFSHYCSHVCFARGDLFENRPERKPLLDKLFPDGWSVEPDAMRVCDWNAYIDGVRQAAGLALLPGGGQS